MRAGIILILIAQCLFVFPGKAQQWVRKRAVYGVYSINAEAGWYTPKMDYWNAVYLPSVGIDENFGGNMNVGGGITYLIATDWRARARISYWGDEVAGDENSDITKLKISFIRFGLGAIYAPPKISVQKLQPYFGVEGQFYVIKNTASYRSGNTEQFGQDYSYAPLIGLERFFGHFIIRAEYLYNIGHYFQDVNSNTGITRQEVSINGSEFKISAGFRFTSLQ